MGIISILFLVSLLLNSNIFLIKENIVLHVLGTIEKTQIRSLAKNPACLTAFWKPFSCCSIASFLYIINSFSSSLLASLSIATHSSNSAQKIPKMQLSLELYLLKPLILRWQDHPWHRHIPNKQFISSITIEEQLVYFIDKILNF